MTQKPGRWVFFLLFLSYLVLCFTLLLAPERGTFLLPFLGVLIVLVAWWIGPGVSALLVLVATLVGLGLWSQWPEGERAFLLGQLAQLWVLWFFLRERDRRLFQDRQERNAALQSEEKRLAELQKDVDYRRRRAQEVKAQSSQRQRLADCAKDLGAVLDPSEIQNRLVQWTQKSFPDARGFLSGLTEADPVDAWVLQRRQPLLCEDLSGHRFFQNARVEPGTRCLMVAPLWVENKIFGGLRVESPAPRRFHRGDVRVLDALATMASLALDNAVLYHRIEALAVRDGLTGLFTHRAFEERLAEELLRAGRYRYAVSLIMLDVDHFKKVNDTHGHAAGDEVLRRLSRRLLSLARPVDMPARYGGEEFCLLLAETDRDRAAQVAEGFRRDMESERFLSDGRPFQVTVSAGVAAYPAEATTPPQLVRAADQRLYRAKNQGRNRVVAEG